jgi:hypothetical protein
MSDLSTVCTLCQTQINSQFGGTRTAQVINTHMMVTGPCFVADEITFSNNGWLVFQPNTQTQGDDQQEFAVICRKLTIDGGKQPVNTTPCKPQDPGSRYDGTNLITWSGRLTPATSGSPIGPPGSQPPGSGNNGTDGAAGNSGTTGANPVGSKRPATLVVLALEVQVLNKGNLVIDWAGQDGGDGGPGQVGGNAASGTTGNDGSDASWPSSGCDTPTGNGGNGGNGGAGGRGGIGGNGGNAGPIIVISTAQNVSASGPFRGQNTVTFVTKSNGGGGGKGAKGGNGGHGGPPGAKSSECGAGSRGADGSDNTTIASDGGAGSPGAATIPQLETVTTGACADRFPRPLVFDASPTQTYYRCPAGATTEKLTLTGQYLDQVASVSTSLAGVTAAIDNSSTDTELDLTLSIAANSATGPGTLTFNYTFPPALTQALAGAIDVEISQAVSIAPTSGARGSTVNVTLTGTFDPSASHFDVSISGAGVTVGTVTFVNPTTLTCSFVIDSTAGRNLRDVTLKAGPCQSTLLQSFEVT